MRTGKYREARIQFCNAVKLDPKFVDAYYQLSQADLALHEWSEAFAALSKATELDPNRVDAQLTLSQLYFTARDYDHAKEKAQAVLGKDPNNVQAYRILGVSCVRQRQFNQALDIFRKMTDLIPKDASAWFNIASAEVSLKRYADAQQHLQKATEIDPKFVLAYADLARLYRLQDQLQSAEQILRAGLEQNPAAASLYVLWADILYGSGRKEQVEALFGQLRLAQPNPITVAVTLGDFYLQHDDVERAVAEYRQGLSTSPKNMELEKRLEDVFLVLNQVAYAAEIDGQLMKGTPTDATVRIDHGRLLMSQGKLQDSIKILQQVVKDDSDSPQGHYYLAAAYARNGSLEEAKAQLQQVLELSPGLPIAVQALSNLDSPQKASTMMQTYTHDLVLKFPDNASDRLLRAATYVHEPTFKPVGDQFSIAKELPPNQPSVHLDLAKSASVADPRSMVLLGLSLLALATLVRLRKKQSL
jgi:tetratricopeptide (TPR) repeat protein